MGADPAGVHGVGIVKDGYAKATSSPAAFPPPRDGKAHACPASNSKLSEPGRSPWCCLLARCAGVHVDLHANRHFDNLRSFPSHWESPKLLASHLARGPHRCRT